MLLKRKLSQHFQSYLIDEYNTSKLCCKCGHELEKKDNKHRLLIVIIKKWIIKIMKKRLMY